GEGVLYHSNKALRVKKGAYLVIPPQIPHKLWNTGVGSLEHLVFSSPPFNPSDVLIIDESRKTSEPKIEKFNSNADLKKAMDGAIVHELLSRQDQIMLSTGLALGYLPPRKTATRHKHDISEEVYYVMEGKGTVAVRNMVQEVKPGTVVYLPTGVHHGLENTSHRKLEVMCLSSPPYSNSDFSLF
ncbi:cupin domain-containing protein, partial [Candidatus Woesearchaeota archaeon]|nr:cupin domain-containing protein [Candidatus Woesearchaeota archaeon]